MRSRRVWKRSSWCAVHAGIRRHGVVVCVAGHRFERLVAKLGFLDEVFAELEDVYRDLEFSKRTRLVEPLCAAEEFGGVLLRGAGSRVPEVAEDVLLLSVAGYDLRGEKKCFSGSEQKSAHIPCSQTAKT